MICRSGHLHPWRGRRDRTRCRSPSVPTVGYRLHHFGQCSARPTSLGADKPGRVSLLSARPPVVRCLDVIGVGEPVREPNVQQRHDEYERRNGTVAIRSGAGVDSIGLPMHLCWVPIPGVPGSFPPWQAASGAGPLRPRAHPPSSGGSCGGPACGPAASASGPSQTHRAVPFAMPGDESCTDPPDAGSARLRAPVGLFQILSLYSPMNCRRIGLATTSGSRGRFRSATPAPGASSLRSSPPRAGAPIPIIVSLPSIIVIHLRPFRNS